MAGEDRTGWPRVTSVLKAAGLIDTAHFTEFDRDRGTAVHEAARLFLQGALDRSTVDPAVAPRLAQFERFMLDLNPMVLASELEVVHSEFHYAWRLDLALCFPGNGHTAIVDIKGPTRAPWHGMQVEAYRRAWNSPSPTPRVFAALSYTLHLSDTDYRLIPHTDRNDWPRFVAALKEYRHAHANA